jgi:hypothetical protein
MSVENAAFKETIIMEDNDFNHRGTPQYFGIFVVKKWFSFNLIRIRDKIKGNQTLSVCLILIPNSFFFVMTPLCHIVHIGVFT